MSMLEQINKAIEQYEKENNIVMSDEDKKEFIKRILSGLGISEDSINNE